MSVSDHYQAVVIGSGQAGTPLCQALSNAGLRTALVERAHVGGTCVNEGCTPTKTMVASGRVAYIDATSFVVKTVQGDFVKRWPARAADRSNAFSAWSITCLTHR